MRLVYMGTPTFAVTPLLAIVKAGHEIVGVVTRTDKPAGRGRAMAAPAVKTEALQLRLAVYQPGRVREPEFLEVLRQLNPDVIVVAAYGQILPSAILSLPRHGCINIHASLLPAYRGAAPINWAIINGERETGITIMHMDEGMDTGAILLQESIPVEPQDTAGALTEKLSVLGAKLITEALPEIVSGALKPVAQDNARATMAPLLKKEDGLIDWSLPARDIHNRVRGLTPWPGAYTFLDGNMIKLIRTEVVTGSVAAGTISADGTVLEVGTGKDVIRVISLQPAGRKSMTAGDFLRGHRGVKGKKFGNS
jgi:methionyl-tRNA formyltransferase